MIWTTTCAESGSNDDGTAMNCGTLSIGNRGDYDVVQKFVYSYIKMNDVTENECIQMRYPDLPPHVLPQPLIVNALPASTKSSPATNATGCILSENSTIVGNLMRLISLCKVLLL